MGTFFAIEESLSEKFASLEDSDPRMKNLQSLSKQTNRPNQESLQFPVFLKQSGSVPLGKTGTGEDSFDPSQIVEKLVP